MRVYAVHTESRVPVPAIHELPVREARRGQPGDTHRWWCLKAVNVLGGGHYELMGKLSTGNAPLMYFKPVGFFNFQDGVYEVENHVYTRSSGYILYPSNKKRIERGLLGK